MTRRPRHARGRAARRKERPIREPGQSLVDRLRLAIEGVRHARHHNPRLYRNGARGLLVLIGLVAILSVALYVVGLLDTMRLSGTAAVRIVSSVVTGGSSFDQSPSGTYLRYTYVVDGATYAGVDFRRWLNVAAHEPKVCFDPAHPAHHLLVEGSYRCGAGPSP